MHRIFSNSSSKLEGKCDFSSNSKGLSLCVFSDFRIGFYTSDFGQTSDFRFQTSHRLRSDLRLRTLDRRRTDFGRTSRMLRTSDIRLQTLDIRLRTLDTRLLNSDRSRTSDFGL